MTYREKFAWLSLAALAVTFGPYFALVALGPFANDAMPNFRQLILYAIASGVQMTILLVGRWFLRRNDADASLPADERDRAISNRAINYAYWVLMVAMILVGGVMPFRYGGWAIVNAAFFGIVLSQVVS